MKPYASADGKMNADGLAFFNEILAQFDGDPIKYLAGKYPTLLARSSYHKDRDEIHQASLVGLATAVTKWRGGNLTRFCKYMATYIANEIRLVLYGKARAMPDGSTREGPYLTKHKKGGKVMGGIGAEHEDFAKVDLRLDCKTILSKFGPKTRDYLEKRLEGDLSRHSRNDLYMARRRAKTAGMSY